MRLEDVSYFTETRLMNEYTDRNRFFSILIPLLDNTTPKGTFSNAICDVHTDTWTIGDEDLWWNTYKGA